MGKDRGHATSYINLGRRVLGSTYHFLTDLAMPHFGGTDP